MASKNSIVYLGYIDEQVSPKNQHQLSFAISKIGGYPDWCMSECDVPSCFYCQRKMVLIIQLYAPFENSHYHRTLYIFACINPPCWNRSQSWVCLRNQILDSKQTVSSQSCEESVNESWMEGEDDWGSPDIDDGNGNICPSSQLVLEYMARKAKTFADFENTNIGDNLNERKPKSSSNTMAEVTKCMENQMNLNEGDTNANDSLCGAVGMQSNGGDGMEATAVIEGPEGDMIAIETPEQPITDIPALFKEVPSIDTKLDITFTSYFIGTGMEPQEDTTFSEHERELFLRYTNSSGHDLKEEDCFGPSDTQGDNVYEKYSAHHGDTLVHKFKKRILRSPQQILRYCREESASPLWMRPPAPPSIPKACESCGGRMIFEVQIMPQLVSCLRIKDIPLTALEFGTIALYTCMSSCWAEGDKMRREFCFVQAEDI